MTESPPRISFKDDAAEPVPTPPEEQDARLTKVLGLVRAMSEAQLKEQCVLTEWACMDSDVERDILLEAVQDGTFWREVKEAANLDMDALPEEDSEVDTRERLLQMFRCFDKDNRGAIDASEMHQMLLYMGISATEKEVRGMIKNVDADGDGEITSEQFLAIMEAAQAGHLSIAAPTKQNIRRASFRLQEKLGS